jgi:hypothetical protein
MLWGEDNSVNSFINDIFVFYRTCLNIVKLKFPDKSQDVIVIFWVFILYFLAGAYSF